MDSMRMIVFVSNFMNHHQLPFSMEMLRRNDVEYTFIALEPIPKERLDMGYEDMNHKYEFVLCAYDSDDNMRQAKDLIDSADVAIFGSCLDIFMKRRIRKGKLCLKFSERFFKEGAGITRIPHNLASAWKHLKPFEKTSLYFFCSSAYTTADLNRYTDFKRRTFKWGYFPETKKYDVVELMSKKLSVTYEWKRPVVSILWAGRLIGWKHPDASILLAESLKKHRYKFKLTVIGNGHMEQELHMMISEKGLDDCVEMPSAMSPEKVREHMEKANIFLFTSDFNEGWGAVLNESMNSGCAVVASHAIGAVPYLVKHKENGLIYHSGNIDELYENVKYLLDNPAEQERLGRAAYETIVGEWNAETAAERLVALSQKILDGEKQPDLFETGPCSRAEIIQDNWFNP